jgi:hypothetical protein
MRTTSIAAATLAAAALTLGLAGTAHADVHRTDDPDDTAHGSDILALKVRNGLDNLNVVTEHVNLRRDPATGSGGMIFIDTDPDDAGPEYVFVGGFFEGTDYTLLETEGFARSKWGDPVEHGDYIMRVDYAEDRVRVRMSRATIGDAAAVRVAVRASGTRSDGTSDGLVDWVGDRREFTPWVDLG